MRRHGQHNLDQICVPSPRESTNEKPRFSSKHHPQHKHWSWSVSFSTMPKKKRQRTEISSASSSLFNLTGASFGNGIDGNVSTLMGGSALDGCLAEFDDSVPATTDGTTRTDESGPEPSDDDDDDDDGTDNDEDNESDLQPYGRETPKIERKRNLDGIPKQAELWDFSVPNKSTKKTTMKKKSNKTSGLHDSHMVPLNKSRAKEWNTLLRNWETMGQYTPNLLPNFELEQARHFQLEKLSKFVLGTHADVRMPVFERWLIDAKLEERSTATVTNGFVDPILPCLVTVNSPASQRLVQELAEVLPNHDKSTTTDAKRIVSDLCQRTLVAVQELLAVSQRTARRCPLKQSDRVSTQDRDDGMKALLYNRKSWKKPYCVRINGAHYRKLKEMFEAVHGLVLKPSTKSIRAFHLITMCLLLRYSSLSGGQLLQDLRGGGMQGAIPPAVFGALEESLGQRCTECFASPLNAHYLRFESAFSGDLDWHFGSIGNFFDVPLTAGCYEANPPFSPGLMVAMADRLEEVVTSATKNKQHLTFVVVVPTFQDNSIDADDNARIQTMDKPTSRAVKGFAAESFRRLLAMSSAHTVLKSREHMYIEGAQHLRTTSYKQSAYDTSVLIIQSRKAKKATNRKHLVRTIRQAFSGT